MIVSACLLGHPCRYDGRSKPCEAVIKLAHRSDVEIIEVCPEELGGLPTPRVPSEIAEGRVITKDGRDVTCFFKDGAKKVLRIAKENSCEYAILKSLSPSCSSCGIYDGSFSGKVIDGMGITAKLLCENGIKVISENEINL